SVSRGLGDVYKRQSHHRERDADLLALAAEGRMYARSINR
ncbi:hypothetical protein QLF87_23480, partial [Salmonella enterica subsp. enterica serovar Oslo]